MMDERKAKWYDFINPLNWFILIALAIIYFFNEFTVNSMDRFMNSLPGEKK